MENNNLPKGVKAGLDSKTNKVSRYSGEFEADEKDLFAKALEFGRNSNLPYRFTWKENGGDGRINEHRVIRRKYSGDLVEKEGIFVRPKNLKDAVVMKGEQTIFDMTMQSLSTNHDDALFRGESKGAKAFANSKAILVAQKLKEGKINRSTAVFSFQMLYGEGEGEKLLDATIANL